MQLFRRCTEGALNIQGKYGGTMLLPMSTVGYLVFVVQSLLHSVGKFGGLIVAAHVVVDISTKHVLRQALNNVVVLCFLHQHPDDSLCESWEAFGGPKLLQGYLSCSLPITKQLLTYLAEPAKHFSP